MSQNRPRVIAHRGYAADNPENTVAAMGAAAADSRTDAIEIDARATADGRVVVFHDDDLSRLTDAPPAVSETPVWKLSYDEISRYTIGDTEESIPLLEDVLAAIPVSITVNIELKHPGVEGYSSVRSTTLTPARPPPTAGTRSLSAPSGLRPRPTTTCLSPRFMRARWRRPGVSVRRSRLPHSFLTISRLDSLLPPGTTPRRSIHRPTRCSTSRERPPRLASSYLKMPTPLTASSMLGQL
ncbi:MAG: glycerophosphoryl diester phosphodiesterase [Halonotius sp. J07HN4]|nr:MAG: glycerophosphoryl diester phosphodiesterase [Halonotius sp. J07HN4]